MRLCATVAHRGLSGMVAKARRAGRNRAWESGGISSRQGRIADGAGGLQRTMVRGSGLPRRGETLLPALPGRGGRFNPRPRAGATRILRLIQVVSPFSIRAPRTGATSRQSRPGRGASCFNPRPPHGGRQAHRARCVATGTVSIRAPRTGGDRSMIRACRPRACFNPRPPHGGRRVSRTVFTCSSVFQSAPPARGATPASDEHRLWYEVSIRAPRTGGDLDRAGAAAILVHVSIRAPRTGGDRSARSPARSSSCFNPRPPHGGRRAGMKLTASPASRFNPRPPHGGRRAGCGRRPRGAWFQSAPPARGATPASSPTRPARAFQSAPPARGATVGNGAD